MLSVLILIISSKLEAETPCEVRILLNKTKFYNVSSTITEYIRNISKCTVNLEIQDKSAVCSDSLLHEMPKYYPIAHTYFSLADNIFDLKASDIICSDTFKIVFRLPIADNDVFISAFRISTKEYKDDYQPEVESTAAEKALTATVTMMIITLIGLFILTIFFDGKCRKSEQVEDSSCDGDNDGQNPDIENNHLKTNL